MENDSVIISVGALINKNEKYLIARRANVSLAGYWEFPGGRVEKGETDEEALKRELKEELNISAKVDSFFSSNLHEFPNCKVLRKIYNVDIKDINFELSVHDEIKWITLDEMKNYDFAPAEIPNVEKLINSSRITNPL